MDFRKLEFVVSVMAVVLELQVQGELQDNSQSHIKYFYEDDLKRICANCGILGQPTIRECGPNYDAVCGDFCIDNDKYFHPVTKTCEPKTEPKVSVSSTMKSTSETSTVNTSTDSQPPSVELKQTVSLKTFWIVVILSVIALCVVVALIAWLSVKLYKRREKRKLCSFTPSSAMINRPLPNPPSTDSEQKTLVETEDPSTNLSCDEREPLSGIEEIPEDNHLPV